jgi:hypothetical protein
MLLAPGSWPSPASDPGLREDVIIEMIYSFPGPSPQFSSTAANAYLRHQLTRESSALTDRADELELRRRQRP